MIHRIIYSIIVILVVWVGYQKSLSHLYVPKNEYYSPKNKKEKDIHVVTYNIQKFPWSWKSFDHISALVRRHSVILLQECYDETFSSLETHFPNYYITRGTLQGFRLINSGLAILSVFPILETSFVRFQHCNQMTFDCLSEKGYLSALLKVGKTTLRVVNTHLQSCDFERFDPFALKQLDELMSYTRSLKGPYVVGGDFNIDVEETKQRYPKMTFYHSEDPTIYIDFKTGHSQAKNDIGYDGLIFDYFIVQGADQIIPEVVRTLYSDHLPVSTQMQIR